MGVVQGFPDSSVGKESTCNVGDTGSIPGLGRSPGEGIGYPLQYSGLENPMDCTVCGVAKSRTRLSDFHFTSLGCTRSRHIGSSIFIVSCRVLSVAACKLLVAACGIQFPDQGLNWGPLHWESGVLVTGLPGKFQGSGILRMSNNQGILCFLVSSH